MRTHKRILSLMLALVLAFSLGVPAFAAVGDTGFSDVDAGEWYAEAVMYCQEHGLMSGIGDNRFAPEGSLTRAMLVTVLWRQAGSPAVNYLLRFSDVPEGRWYTEGIRWAASEQLIVGYGDGRFGTEDSITQEQLNIIFRQYTDKPVTVDIPGFDGSARPVTRAQAAAAVMNYDRMTQSAGDAKILIAYFTVPETSGVDAVAQASRVVENGQVVGNVEFIANTTRGVARQIAEYANGDLAEIKRAQPYGNLQDEAKAEIDNGSRPDITVDVSNLDQYDVIFIGYPIWWDEAPAMIATFLAENDLSGKVVAPFCTSSYSPITNSLHVFRELASGATVVDGLTANSESAVRPWVDQVLSRAGK